MSNQPAKAIDPQLLKRHFYKVTFIFTSLLFLLIINNSVFASAGRIEALQMPAWLERSGQLMPITPGMELKQGDTLKTGSNARLLMRMEEGSLVKLGENAELGFDVLIPAEEKKGAFEAALNVLKGAFRFTTTASGKNIQRIVSVSIGAVTAGVRGTDIWGSSTLEKDILCLIEGKITAQRKGEPEFVMEEALSFYIVPKDKPALPVSPVPEEKLAKWSKETDLQKSTGVLSINGEWAVNLMSVTNESSIKPVVASLAAAGFAAKIEMAEVNGKNWYRLRINGFDTLKDARAFATSMSGEFGISQAWAVKF